MYVFLYVKSPAFLSDLDEQECSFTDFLKVLN